MSCKHGNSDFSFDPCEECEECKEELDQWNSAYAAGRSSVFKELTKTGTCVEAMQSAEIAKLKEVIAKCSTLLPKRTPGGFVSFGEFYAEQENMFADPYNLMSKFKKRYLSDCEEALAAIKEIKK